MTTTPKNKKIIGVRPRATLILKLTEKEYREVYKIAEQRNTTPAIYIKQTIFKIYDQRNVTVSFRNRLKKDIEQLQEQEI